MVLIGCDTPDLNSFLGIYGYIMHKELIKWLKKNKLPENYRPYMKVKFYMKFDPDVETTKVTNVEPIVIEKIIKQETKTKKTIKVNNPPQQKFATQKHQVEKMTVTQSIEDKGGGKPNDDTKSTDGNVSCEWSTTQTQVEYYQIGQSDDKFIYPTYDYCFEKESSTQTNIVTHQDASTQTLYELTPHSVDEIVRPTDAVLLNQEKLKEILDDSKHVEIKFTDDEITTIKKTKVVNIDNKHKLKHVIASLLLQLREEEDVYNSDDEEIKRAKLQLIREFGLGDPRNEDYYTDDEDSDFG
jgi:hypothetical protein